MNEETEFLVVIGPLIFQIFILFVFYFAALRRLFIPPTPSNVLVLAIVFIGIPGFLLVFLWGWIRHKRKRITQLMVAWTLALVVFVICMVVLANVENSAPQWLTVAISISSTLVIGVAAIRVLIPFLQVDERMRALMRESNAERIAHLARLGPQALPSIQLMLEDDYSQYRLDGVECLLVMGPAGVPLLQDAAKSSDSQLAGAARAALEEMDHAPDRS